MNGRKTFGGEYVSPITFTTTEDSDFILECYAWSYNFSTLSQLSHSGSLAFIAFPISGHDREYF